MNTTCPELLSRVRFLQNQEAWETFVQIYHKTVVRWILRASSNQLENELEDVAQEVFIVIFQRIGTFERECIGSLRGWMKAIVRNVVLKRLDNARRHNSYSLPEEFDVVDHESLKERENDRIELVEQAKVLIRKNFKASTWRAFEMIYIEGRSPKEVSDTLGMTENAVYISTSRILSKLRLAIDQFIDSEK